jgi:plastocyanin
LALAAGLLAVAPGFLGPARAATTTVIERGVAYVPRQVDIAVGDTVVWSYESAPNNAGHTVTFDSGPDLNPTCNGGLLDTGCQSRANPTVQRTFASVGTFPYHCKIHGGAGGQGMAGVVVVTAAAATTTTTAASSTSTTVKASTTTTVKVTSSTTSTTRALATSSTVIKSTTTTSDTSSVLLPGDPPPFSSEDSSSKAADGGGGSGGGSGSGTVLLIVGLLLAVSAGGGFLLWRLRPGRV